MAMMAFGSSMIGEGLTDVEKRLFVFNALVDPLLLLDVLALGDSVRWMVSAVSRRGRD
jgi:hypothetical protein